MPKEVLSQRRDIRAEAEIRKAFLEILAKRKAAEARSGGGQISLNYFIGAITAATKRIEAEYELTSERALAIVAKVGKAIGLTDETDSDDLSSSSRSLAEAHTLSLRANALNQQGLYAEAEAIYKRVVLLRENFLGPQHPHLATALNNLGGLYRAIGRYTEAETCLMRAVTMYENTLGRDDLYVARSLNTLAVISNHLGRHKQAEDAMKRALAIQETVPGEDDAYVARGLNTLGSTYQQQGRYAEAEPLLKRALAIREKALGPEHRDVANSANSLALLYHRRGRYDEAEPLFQRALSIREKVLGIEHSDVATSLHNLACLNNDQGRYAEAEGNLKRALQIWEKSVGLDHDYVSHALRKLGASCEHQGRYDEAERLYERAASISERALGSDSVDFATALNDLATIYDKRGRQDDAELAMKRALEISERTLGSNHPYVAERLVNLAAVYSSQNRDNYAKPLLERAIRIERKALGASHPTVASSFNNLSAIYGRLGRYRDAERLLQRALKMYEKTHGTDHPELIRTLNNIAEAQRAGGHLEKAMQSSSQGVSILLKHLSINTRQISRSADGQLLPYREYLENHLAIATELAGRWADSDGQVGLALATFGVAQVMHASAGAQAIVRMASRFAAGSDSLAGMVREHQDLTHRWRLLDADLVSMFSREGSERDAAEEEALRAAIETTVRQINETHARVIAEFPNYTDLIDSRPLTPDLVQGLIAEDEALLVYVSGEVDSWLWVVRREAVSFIHLEIDSPTLATEVAALRASLNPDTNPALEAFPVARSHAAYQRIIAPAMPYLAGARHLIIVPDGPLQSLPLGVLVTQAPHEEPVVPSDHRQVAWLARDYAITVLPSVSSLRALRHDAAASMASAPFLGIGDPVLRGRPSQERMARPACYFRGNLADVERVRELAPLPETAHELRAIARLLGATESDLLLRERACEPALRRTQLDRYRIIAFSTHGLVSGDLEGLGEPALVLTPPDVATPENDGLLTASKIATLKLDAEWVVLSACNTATDDGTPDAGGLASLTKAFFYAGARALLVSHWPVWSDATVLLATRTFEALAHDTSIGRSEALRRAMMTMLDSSERPDFAHPQAWAPFIVTGEGRALYGQPPAGFVLSAKRS